MDSSILEYAQFLEENDKNSQEQAPQSDPALMGPRGAQELIKTWTEDDTVDTAENNPMLRKTWAFRSKAVKLTFLDEEKEKEFIALGEISRAILNMDIPEYEYTTEMMLQEEQIMLNFFSNLRRAVGIPANLVNERILESGTFNVNMTQKAHSFKSDQPSSKGGLIRFFGGR